MMACGHHGTIFSSLRYGFLCITLSLPIYPIDARADDAADIRSRLQQWTASFNSRDKAGACDLFSRSLISDVRGQGEANYETRCAAIGKALDDRKKSFHYSVNIKEIIVDKTIAIVRLDWTLKISPGDIVSAEIGLDVFRKEDDGHWRIIRFIAYDPD